MPQKERVAYVAWARLAWTAAWAALLFLLPPAARASEGSAPDFPPGSFSDGGHYSLDDFKGKLVVLFFYEKDCPTCRGLIPTRNAVVEQFKGKPVVFLAVGPNDSMSDVIGYARGTHLEMTTFADTLGVMEARYGFHISLNNIYQFRYIGPDGNVAEAGTQLTAALVEKALQKVKWKYKDGVTDPKLNNAVMLLEWNQYKAGLQALRPYLKSKPAADSAQKLYDAVKAEGSQWLEQAEQVKAADAVKAYDLYARVSSCFAGEDLAKTADAALKTLKTDKAVQDELAARQQYDALSNVMTHATSRNRGEIIAYCNGISSKHPNSPTGKKAAQLAKDLQAAAGNSGQ